MAQPMTKPTPRPLSLTLPAPGALAGTLALGGLVAELVVRRADGAPLSPEDEQQAAWLVKESENTAPSDDEAAATAQAYLDKQNG